MIFLISTNHQYLVVGFFCLKLKEDDRMIWIGYAAAWISTAAAVIAGMYLTGSAWCLWALLIPLMIKMEHRETGDTDKS